MKYDFEVGELVILNEKIEKDYPGHSGDLCVVTRIVTTSPNFAYDVQLPNMDICPVRVSEINKLTKEQKEIITYITKDNEVIYKPTNEKVKILKVDYLNWKVEINHRDGSNRVVDVNTLRKLDYIEFQEMGKYTKLGLHIGEFTDEKNKQYGSSVDATYEMMKVLMERYTYDEENYLVPQSLLKHVLLQVRMMDKQNRIFNNPSGEGDSESPYNDLAGYSLIGIEMVNRDERINS